MGDLAWARILREGLWIPPEGLCGSGRILRLSCKASRPTLVQWNFVLRGSVTWRFVAWLSHRCEAARLTPLSRPRPLSPTDARLRLDTMRHAMLGYAREPPVGFEEITVADPTPE